MDAAADLLFGQQGEEAFDLIDPGARGRCEMDMPSGALGEPVRMSAILWVPALSMTRCIRVQTVAAEAGDTLRHSTLAVSCPVT